MKQEYVKIRFNEKTLQVIWKANQIIEEYQVKGFSLTLRQLYYQFVARDLIPNKSREYDKLGSVINNARLDRHRAGNGAKLLKAANIAGINYQLVRLWSGANRDFERKLKRQKHSKRFCPQCNPLGCNKNKIGEAI